MTLLARAGADVQSALTTLALGIICMSRCQPLVTCQQYTERRNAIVTRGNPRPNPDLTP